jgi:hypothetical protein
MLLVRRAQRAMVLLQLWMMCLHRMLQMFPKLKKTKV